METVDAGDIQKIAEQDRISVLVQGVMLYGKSRILWVKALHQHVVKFRYFYRVA